MGSNRYDYHYKSYREYNRLPASILNAESNSQKKKHSIKDVILFYCQITVYIH